MVAEILIIQFIHMHLDKLFTVNVFQLSGYFKISIVGQWASFNQHIGQFQLDCKPENKPIVQS